MKKIITIILSAILLVCLVGCGKTEVAIEDYQWELTLIQSNKDGSIIGCGSEHYEMHKEIECIKVVDLTLTAENSSLTITNITSNASYNGTYKVNNSKKKSMIYDIVIGEESGYATSAYTEYKDGTGTTQRTPTLIVSIGDYSLNFQYELAVECD